MIVGTFPLRRACFSMIMGPLPLYTTFLTHDHGVRAAEPVAGGGADGCFPGGMVVGV
jgi:hypothetical protein